MSPSWGDQGGFGGRGRGGKTAYTVTCTPAVGFPCYLNVATGLQQRSTDVRQISIAPEAEARGSSWHQCCTPACAARAATWDDFLFFWLLFCRFPRPRTLMCSAAAAGERGVPSTTRGWILCYASRVLRGSAGEGVEAEERTKGRLVAGDGWCGREQLVQISTPYTVSICAYLWCLETMEYLLAATRLHGLRRPALGSVRPILALCFAFAHPWHLVLFRGPSPPLTMT